MLACFLSVGVHFLVGWVRIDFSSVRVRRGSIGFEFYLGSVLFHLGWHFNSVGLSVVWCVWDSF